MRKDIAILAVALVLFVGAVAAEPFNLSGKDFSDIDMFNGTTAMVSEDLGGTSASMMGIDMAFLADNPEDGMPPENMPNKPSMQYVGSSVGYQQQGTRHFTPAELESWMNTWMLQ